MLEVLEGVFRTVVEYCALGLEVVGGPHRDVDRHKVRVRDV